MKRSILTIVLSGSALLCYAQTTAEEWYDEGLSRKDAGDYDGAIEAFSSATELKADYSDALFELGWCYNEAGMYEEAIETLTYELEHNAADPASTDFELGYAYEMLKEYDTAIGYFTYAVDMDAAYGSALRERGFCYYRLHDYESALLDFYGYEDVAGGLGTLDEDADYYYTRGWSENELGYYEDAVNSMNDCIAVDNEEADCYMELGYAQYKLGDDDLAVENYHISNELYPDDGPLFGIGDVYFDNVKNYDSATKYYRAGLALRPDNQIANYRLGWCYNDRALYELAVGALEKALELNSEDNESRTELGYALYKLAQYDGALSHLRVVVNTDLEHEVSRYYAGLCYAMNGDQESLKKMKAQLEALESDYAPKLTEYVK